MKYLIIGAGGTGGVVGFHMAQAGKDVTLIARDAHLESIQQKGLTLQTMWDENTKTIPVKASDMQHYKDRPDVILVCVKGYSLDGIYEFIRRIAKPQTIVIPILNIYGTGAKMQEKLPGMLVTDGCIYVSANIKEPGVILQHGKILRIFFGVRQKEEKCQLLEQIQKDMFARAKAHRDSHTYVATTLDEMKEIAENKPGFIKAMWCGNQECEDKLKEVVGVTSRCIPFNQEHLADTCVCCGKPATKMVYWGKAY